MENQKAVIQDAATAGLKVKALIKHYAQNIAPLIGKTPEEVIQELNDIIQEIKQNDYTTK